jgi:hypothetical protein
LEFPFTLNAVKGLNSNASATSWRERIIFKSCPINGSIVPAAKSLA